MVPSATLLLRLSLLSKDWSTDWSNIEEISKLRIGDPACGTGTLLKAARQSIIDNYIVSTVENGLKNLALPKLHKC